MPESAQVGVVGDRPGVEEAVEAAGATPVVGEPEDVVGREQAAVVAVGEPAVLSLARAGVEAPVLPVEAGRGVQSVPERDVEAALERLLDGEWTPVDHPVIAADPGGARALMELTLVAAEPARISEYTVLAGGDRIASFRADGVVAATPAGSVGYARAVGGPTVAPGSGVVAVVPVAPFAIDPDHWVFPLGEVSLAVARDETPVELLADDRSVDAVTPGEPIRLRRDGALTVATVPESRSFYARE